MTQRPIPTLVAAALLATAFIWSSPAGTAAQVAAQPQGLSRGAQALLARVRRVHRQGERSSEDIAALLDEARASHDQRFEGCLDRRLSEINAHLRMIEDRYRLLMQMIETHRPDDARRIVAVVERIGHRVTEVEMQAYSCPGARVRSHEGQVEVQVTGPARR